MRWMRFAGRSLGRAWRFARRQAGRRPRAALILGALGLLSLTMLPDLFYAIPWTYRKGIGWAAFGGLVVACVVRLGQIRPTDDRVPPDPSPSPWWWGCLPVLTCATLAVPLLAGPGNFGAGDWDLSLQKYEAVRRTILEWGQFPWWDPWCRGGFALAANPQVGVIGVATPLVLGLGTSVGIRLAAIVCLLVAIEGTRRLALLWLGEPLAALAAGLIYGINGGLLVQLVAGYHTPMSYCAYPWMIYYATRLDRRPIDGVWLGVWLAFDVLNGINYLSVYASMIVSVVWLRAVLARVGPSRTRYLIHTILAIGTLLTLAGWRLATTGMVYRDFPRHYTSGYDESPLAILIHLLARPTSGMILKETGTYFWEAVWYVGPVVFLLAAESLSLGWRWWHTLAFGCGWLAMGSVAWYHPSYWLAEGPLFATMHVVTRWRFMAVLGLAMASADVLARWRLGPSRARRRLAVVLVALIAADYLTLGREILPVSFRIAPAESEFPGAPVPSVVQVARSLGYPAVLRNYGVIQLQEPLLGYDLTAETSRRGRDDADYRGEAWTDGGPIKPRSWSPNRITFQVAPGQSVDVNQNPGSWWLANGRPAFPGFRCAETRRDFRVQADDRGRLDLQIRPRGLGLGLALHVIGLSLVAVGLVPVAASLRARRLQGPATGP